MATAMKHGGNEKRYRPLDPKSLSSQKVARAASDLQTAARAFGVALREGAELRAHDLVDNVKHRLEDAHVGVEALIARVPAVGPAVAMQLFRATHHTPSEDELPVAPSNRAEPLAEGNSTLAYLECIGA